MNNSIQSESSLSIADDLDLSSISLSDTPQDVLFPDELNKYLKDQVKYLTHENGMLHKNLHETQMSLKQSTEKIESLNSQVKEYQQTSISKSNAILNGISSNDIVSSKIVELSKKLRERNSELAVCKTKCSKLEQRIFDIEKDKIIKVEEPEVIKPKNELEEQIKTLQDKLSCTHSKLCEARNSNMQLKNDIKLSNKVLQQEVGDGIENLHTLANSNWRGRAQTICDLQQKCNDLREKLKMYQDKEKGRNNDVPISKTDKRIDALTKENSDLKVNLQECKKKVDACKARNKVFESETMVLKTKVSMLMEQGDRDSQTITSLTAKVSCAQEMQNDALYKKQLIIQKLDKENKSLLMDISKYECKVDNFKAELEQRRKDIENLKMNVRHQQSSTPQLEPPQVPDDCKTKSKLQAERLRLLELLKTTNDRLDAERTLHSEVASKFRAERQKAAKLEAKVARLQLDQQSDRTSVYSSYSLTKLKDNSNCQDRLQLAEETIKSLETKLQIEQQEHKADIVEFSRILSDYGFIRSENKNSD